MLLFKLTLIMHPQLGILISLKIWKTKFKSRKINAFGVVCSLIRWIDIPKNEFQTLNWLPVKDRFNQSINSFVFKYSTKQCPSYLNEVFELACPNNLRIRNSYSKLICPIRKTNTGKNALSSFLGPSICNKIPEVLKQNRCCSETFSFSSSSTST